MRTTHLLEKSLHTRKERKGFALIIAIMLMAFILMLLLSLTAIVQMETQAGDLAMKATQAREQARYAALVALGQLQKHAGDDRRSTARADILPDTSASNYPNVVSSLAHVNNRNWTGVWNYQAGQPYVHWLVSWNGGAPEDLLSASPASFKPVAPINTTNPLAVTMVGPGTVANASDEVYVYKHDAGENGRIAYWVSDEGVKADISAADPYDTVANDPKDGLLSLGGGLEALPDFALYRSAHASNFEEKLSSGLSFITPDLRHMELFDPNLIGKRAQLFHDVTGQHQGVLADSKNGGLKKDLTTVFNAPLGSLPAGFDNALVFPPANGGSPTDSDPGGPLWNLYHDWYRMNDANNSSLAPREHTDTQHGFHPIIAYVDLYMHVTYDESALPGTPNVRFYYFPSVVLWNPYNVDISSASYRFTINFNGTFNRAEFFPANNGWGTWSIDWGSGAPNLVWPSVFAVDNNTYNSPYNMVFDLSSTTIPAGQGVRFALEGNHEQLDSGSNELSPTADIGYGFYSTCPTHITLPTPIHDGWSYNTHIRMRPDLWKHGLIDFVLEQGATTIHEVNNCNADGIGEVWNWGGGTRAIEKLLPPPPNNLPMQFADDPYDPGSGYVNFPLTGFQFGLKLSEEDPVPEPYYTKHLGIPWLGQYNPRAPRSSRSPLEQQDASWGNGGYTSNPSYFGTALNFPTGANDWTRGGVNPYMGKRWTDSGGNGTQTTILFEIPRPTADTPAALSIGDLMHVMPFKDTASSNDVVRGRRNANWMPAYPLGNSLADPRIPNTTTIRTSWPVMPSFEADTDMVHYDYSYLLNETFFDAYFFSTLPATAADLPDPTSTDPNVANLPDARMLQLTRHDGSHLTELFEYDKASAHLMVDGAFNVNSTSVNAWAAFLHRMSGADMDWERTNAGGGSTSGTYNSGDNAFFNRFRVPGAAPDETSTGLRDYAGFRQVIPADTQLLAEEIVEVVRKRGPFSSLSGFVNRSLDPADPVEERIQGALTEALARTTLNDQLNTNNHEELAATDIDGTIGNWETTQGPNVWSFIEYEVDQLYGAHAQNAPGWLSQADILRQAGDTLQVRSDTFVIRGYGEAYNSVTQEIDAHAYCEIVVQRLPDYADASNHPSTAPASLTSYNQTFGRKFRIISFRWLNDEEV